MMSKGWIVGIAVAGVLFVGVNVAGWLMFRSTGQPASAPPAPTASRTGKAAPVAEESPPEAPPPENPAASAGSPGPQDQEDPNVPHLKPPQKMEMPAGNKPPIPDNPDAKGEPTPEEMQEKMQKARAGQFCTGAAQANLSTREFMIRQRKTPNLGLPISEGARVLFGGFPVVVYSFTGDRSKTSVATEARRALTAKGICTWAAPLITVPSGTASPAQMRAIEVYLPVAAEESVEPPLKKGYVEAGMAFVGKPSLASKTRPEDIAAFLAQVRTSGATPVGPLLAREDDQDTLTRDDDTVQFIQPIAVPQAP